ncbi:MAG: cytochrome c peroxidase [Pseudomonadota bacterium]
MRSLVFILLASTSNAIADPWPEPVSEAMYRPIDLEVAKLGQLLFYDPILSGNKNISCATCHHPKFGTGDGVSLSLGEGGIGLGPDRKADPDNLPEQRIPRHAQALFNLGASEFNVLFHDGRIEVGPEGLRTPLSTDMVAGFSSLLSAQTMFPVLSQDEMAGHYSENDISKAVRRGVITGPGGAWDLIAKRVSDIPQYAQEFTRLYPSISDAEDVGFTDISNAIADFVAFEWRSDSSLFDAVLRGNAQLEGDAAQGAALFFGSASCAQCHSGAFQTDHGFHAMGQPQFGPGKAARFETHARDEGRMRVTGRIEDRFAFRTPSLRNVTLTAPYGHTGAFTDLDSFLRAHSDPQNAWDQFDPTSVILPPLEAKDWTIADDPDARLEIAGMVTQTAVHLSNQERKQLIAFLKSLEDPVAISGRLGVPASVPSGLPVER